MAKKKKTAKKKASKKTIKKAKKVSKKKTSGKTSKKTSKSRVSPKKASKKSSPSMGGGDYSSSFPSSLSQNSSFPGSTYKAYGLDQRGARFTGRRLGVLIFCVLVVVILAIWGWGSYTGEEVMGDRSEPETQESQDPYDTEQEAEGNGENLEPGTNSTPLESEKEGQQTPPEQETAPTGSSSVEQSDKSPSSDSYGQDSRVYTVQNGDNLSKIAQKMLGDSRRYKEILDLNGMSSPNQIKVGQEIKIPVR